MRRALILLLLAYPAVAQEKTGATAASACGPLDVKFAVDQNQTKSVEPDSGKALVYVVEDIGKSGADASWAARPSGLASIERG
jgi:hypothetical protein